MTNLKIGLMCAALGAALYVLGILLERRHSRVRLPDGDETRKEYVAGFLFRNGGSEAALVMKTHPAWQKDKLNGLGGGVEPGEKPAASMRREFLEEAGADVEPWRHFCELRHQGRVIHYFAAHGNHDLKSMTDEAVGWYRVAELPDLPTIPNLKWLIPMALDKDEVEAVVVDQS